MIRNILVLLLMLLLPVSSHAATTAGKVTFSTGTPKATDNSGSMRLLRKGGVILSGDTINTQTGLLQVKFSDGAFMSFKPNSRFKIEEYQFKGKQDGSEKASFRLFKGGLRTVTGKIGKRNRQAYKLKAGVATIGIRGTKFSLELNGKLVIHMGEDGSLEIHHDGKVLFLTSNEVATIGGKEAIINLIKSGGIDALGPVGEQRASGGGGDDGFVAGDQVNGDGESLGVREGEVGDEGEVPL